MNARWAALSRGEQLFAAGAALIFVIGDLLIRLLGLFSGEGFGLEPAIAITAALAIVFVYVEHSHTVAVSWPMSYPLVLAVLTVIIAVAALDGFLGSLKTLGQESGLDLLSSFCVWVGAALMVAGWYLHWTERGA